MHLYKSFPKIEGVKTIDVAKALYGFDNQDYFYLLAYPDYTSQYPVQGARVKRLAENGIEYNYFDFELKDFPILFRVDYSKIGLDHPDNFSIEWINSPGMGYSNFVKLTGNSRIIRHREDQINWYYHTNTDFENDISGKFDIMTFVDVYDLPWQKEGQNAPLIWQVSNLSNGGTVITMSFDTLVDKLEFTDPFNATVTVYDNVEQHKFFKLNLDSAAWFGGNYLKVWKDGLEFSLYLESGNSNVLNKYTGIPQAPPTTVTGFWQGTQAEYNALTVVRPSWIYFIKA